MARPNKEEPQDHPSTSSSHLQYTHPSDNHSHTHVYRYGSLGLSLTDTLDDLINDQRIEPQLAMKVLANFDRVVTEVLAEKVKARLTFKVFQYIPG
jgi:hypothetical protein